jgi:hypothetical protein
MDPTGAFFEDFLTLVFFAEDFFVEGFFFTSAHVVALEFNTIDAIKLPFFDLPDAITAVLPFGSK